MKPFYKWVGGKRDLLPAILPHLNLDRLKAGGRYVEPFLGGGAVALAVSAQAPGADVIVGDVNPRIVNLWRMVRDRLADVLQAYEGLVAEHSEELFARVRSLQVPEDGPVAAARFLYVNRAGFNGLYRENRKGACNVPWGKRPAASLELDKDNLQAVSRAIQRWAIRAGSYQQITTWAQDAATVYVDPPYAPASASASFTGYAGGSRGWEGDEQRKLFAWLAALPPGIQVVASNSDTPLIQALYGGWSLHSTSRSGRVSCKGAGRQPVAELVMVRP